MSTIMIQLTPDDIPNNLAVVRLKVSNYNILQARACKNVEYNSRENNSQHYNIVL